MRPLDGSECSVGWAAPRFLDITSKLGEYVLTDNSYSEQMIVDELLEAE
jgi:hypothetical protein